MKLGFALSSGGLLLPYHLGVLDGLQHKGWLKPETPIAGASAGAIAVASHACSINSQMILDDTIAISDTCRELGRARGNLLPLLREKLERRIDHDRFQEYQQRPAEAVVSYHEVFPTFGPVHQTDFEHKEEFIDAICHSSSFPFFTSNWPVILDYTKGRKHEIMTLGQRKISLEIPRLVVDGYFAVPRERFGCPDFDLAGVEVDRTISITTFPREVIGLTNDIEECDYIGPNLIDDGIQQSVRLLRLATQPSSAEEMASLYEEGFCDAEKWCRAEEIRDRKRELEMINEARQDG
jgi:hypothetical protein